MLDYKSYPLPERCPRLKGYWSAFRGPQVAILSCALGLIAGACTLPTSGLATEDAEDAALGVSGESEMLEGAEISPLGAGSQLGSVGMAQTATPMQPMAGMAAPPMAAQPNPTPEATDTTAEPSEALPPMDTGAQAPMPEPAIDPGNMTDTPPEPTEPAMDEDEEDDEPSAADADASSDGDPLDPVADFAQQTACAVEFASCLLPNPLDYAACSESIADHCDLGEAGAWPFPGENGDLANPACLAEFSNCLLLTPESPEACSAKLEMCSL